MEDVKKSIEELEVRLEQISTAKERSLALLRDRLSELSVHEDRQVEFIENGMLSMLNPATQKIKITTKKIITSDFQLMRKIYTRNIFLLRERIRQMDEDLKVVIAKLESMKVETLDAEPEPKPEPEPESDPGPANLEPEPTEQSA